MLRVSIALAFLLAACSGSQAPSPSPTPTDPPPDEPAPTVEPPGSAQGEPCPDDRCADGLECVHYYGIAGANGPEFTSCEIRCAADASVCPDGQSCITVADGPGQVCRPE
jgi:hypothetical protein